MRPAPFLPLASLVLVGQAAYTPRADLEAGRYLKTLWDAEARLKADPRDALAWAAKSQALTALLRLGEAMDAANRALALSPALADALLARGMARGGLAVQQRTLASVGNIRGAMDDLRAATRADGRLQVAWMTLGLGYQLLPGVLGGSVKRALDCADQLRKVNAPRGDLLAGTILAEEGRWAEAEPCFRRALAAASGDGQIIYGYLESLGSRETGKALGEATQRQRLAAEARRLLPLARGQGRALGAVSEALLEAEQAEEAWQVAKEGLAASDAPTLLRVQLGKVAARAGIHREEGLEILDQALRESLEGGSGGYANVHWRRGQILNALGRKAEARAAVGESLKVDPRHRGATRLLKELG
jgi:tetratricopeptide (TPR) repeat protein